VNETPLTVIIPCKNELPNIEACIDSAREIADEVIVADSGSTDGTLELVRSRGDCRVIEREYVNSANFKNWAIPQATHDWVLLVDADERVTPDLTKEISILKIETLSTTPMSAFWIGRQNHFMGQRIRYSGWQKDGVVRLFRRECRYEEKHVHAELELSNQAIGRLNSSLSHYTFRSFEHYLEKMQRYTTWGAHDAHHRGHCFHLSDLVIRPGFRFIRHYILKRGFLDGKAGFTISCLAATSVMWKYLKLWELQNSKTPQHQQTDKRSDSPFQSAA